MLPETKIAAKLLNGLQVIILKGDWRLVCSDERALFFDHLGLSESGSNGKSGTSRVNSSGSPTTIHSDRLTGDEACSRTAQP
jgi:hypothetical protein